MDIELGPCAEFSIYHLVELQEGEERLKLKDDSHALYRQEVTVIGHGLENATTSKEPPAYPEQEKQTPTVSKAPAAENPYPASPKSLGDIARVLRSKNAGPYEITFDVMFASKPIFDLVKASGLLNAGKIAELNGIKEDQIIWSGFFDQALAYKATIPRLRKGKPSPNGGFMENDVHGSQKYIGLLNMPLPEDFVCKWDAMVAREQGVTDIRTVISPAEP